MNLSPEEKVAERLYTLLREGRMGKNTFIKNAQNLEEFSPLGGAYLRWLLLRRFK
jgi:hypothetical protein